MTLDYTPALNAAITAALEAGRLLRQEFYRQDGPRGSDSHADIDEEVEQIIKKQLLAAFPWNYLGEELGAENNGDEHHVWLVDPHDGTSAFLKGWRGSSVSIGALRDGVPILGVVYAFGYPDDEGDLIAWAEGCPLTRNRQPIRVDLTHGSLQGDGVSPSVVFLSQDGDSNSAANTVCVRPARFITLPSIAYRLARVAAGDGVACVSLASPCGWDYGAGHALLRGAGGILVNERGEEVQYSLAGQSVTGWCFGGSPAVVRELSRRNWQHVHQPSPAATAPYCLVRPVSTWAVAGPQLARAQGCLLGQLAGDSLGGLVEFRAMFNIMNQYPRGIRELTDGGTWRNLAGQPTDDSESALMLARMLAHEGYYDPGNALDAYVHWWPHAWDRGGTLSQALSPTCRDGDTTEERLEVAARNASTQSQSNGSLMRISPLGIFGAGRPALAADWARADSRLTHPHIVCQDACAVFVAAIATAVGKCCSVEQCYQAAIQEANRSNVNDAIHQALENARHSRPEDYSDKMGWVLIALQNAFYQLLHAPNLEEGIVDTVMHGGDTDTNGAIAGALLGAAHGRKAIPSRWMHTLLCCRPIEGTAHRQPVEFWPVDALELAERLLWVGQRQAHDGT